MQARLPDARLEVYQVHGTTIAVCSAYRRCFTVCQLCTSTVIGTCSYRYGKAQYGFIRVQTVSEFGTRGCWSCVAQGEGLGAL